MGNYKYSRSLLFFLLSLISFEGISQGFGETEAELDSIYQERILMEEIDGVYIPVDLDDAFTELERLSSAADIDKFKNATEEVVRDKLHFGLGRWMEYNWGFYMGSRLSHYLKGLGLEHPDDMAKVLLVSWHRHLNEKPLEIEEQVDVYFKIREQERSDRANGKELVHKEIRKGKN